MHDKTLYSMCERRVKYFVHGMSRLGLVVFVNGYYGIAAFICLITTQSLITMSSLDLKIVELTRAGKQGRIIHSGAYMSSFGPSERFSFRIPNPNLHMKII